MGPCHFGCGTHIDSFRDVGGWGAGQFGDRWWSQTLTLGLTHGICRSPDIERSPKMVLNKLPTVQPMDIMDLLIRREKRLGNRDRLLNLPHFHTNALGTIILSTSLATDDLGDLRRPLASVQSF